MTWGLQDFAVACVVGNSAGAGAIWIHTCSAKHWPGHYGAAQTAGDSDSDLAELYGVETKRRFNEVIKHHHNSA
jgi:hypothetical protein